MDNDIPFTDIYAGDEMLKRIMDVIKSKQYVKGDENKKFEQEFAKMCGVKHAVTVSSGTSALLLSMKCMDIGTGDEVLVPAHTFFATVSPILELGATPIFVDINQVNYTMDPVDLARKAEQAGNPTAVIPVHIYGHMADMDTIKEIAADYDLTIIEDACQSHAAEYNGQRAGSLGDLGCFSFYPSKNMTVGGDGGMITTDNDESARLARRYRNHGRNEDGIHCKLGLNHRMSELAAAIGRVQLDHVVRWGHDRNTAAAVYEEKLTDIEEVTTPTESDDVHHVYHLYVVQIPDRDNLRAYLDDQGIETGIHYPTPAHQHPAVKEHVGTTDDVDRTEELCDRVLSLPMHPRINESEIETVCSAIHDYYGSET